MQISQNRSVIDWSVHHSNSPRERSDAMAQRLEQPLIFSIDDRLAEQHLTRLDLALKGLRKIDPLPHGIQFNVVNFDQNEISRIEHLETLNHLIQLSIAHNRLDDIRLLSRLRSLQKLNLSYNRIDSIDPLRNLQNLILVNLSNNNIVSIAALNACPLLQSVDASCNAIQQIDDLSRLTSLKYLNLHKNYLDTLLSAGRHWPKSLHTLVISDNELQDLTEIACLSSFIDLNALYIENNPCLSVVDERYGSNYYQSFDYRPYVLNWCLTINNLDGIFITRKESLKAEWLLSQGKGRAFRAGEHDELVAYLTKVCGTDTNERDDLHLSRIMAQQNFYQHNRQSTPAIDINVRGSSTFTPDVVPPNRAEVVRDVPLVSPRIEIRSNIQNATKETAVARTPSPGPSRSQTISEDSRRYNNYDNRPIKPLDQKLLETKLNEYPVENISTSPPNSARTRNTTKRVPVHLPYNANRYSPKTASRGPTTSNTLHSRTTKTLSRYSTVRTKRATRSSEHSFETRPTQMRRVAVKVTPERQTSVIESIENNQMHKDSPHDDHDNDDEEYDDVVTTAPINQDLFNRSTTMNNSIDIQKLTSSMETMRTSVLQAYFDLHDRFTKTTELQTSALTALWKKCESQTSTFQHETDRLVQENRSLHQRIQELERRLNENDRQTFSSVVPLHPPLRAHISKRDTKSFFLHWIPNPLNEQRKILGYRIYIDDQLKGAIGPGQFEAIIDSIRDEGEYRIKIRTFDQNGESADSNIVVARFRRQRSTTIEETPKNPSEFFIDSNDKRDENLVNSTREDTRVPIVLEKRWSDSAIPMFQQENPISASTPEKIPTPIDDQFSPLGTSPLSSTPTYVHEHLLSRKPPRSPTLSPSHSGKVSPSLASCNKVLFSTNPTQQSEPATTIVRTAKQSPTRSGIMSRLVKSPYRVKRMNNALLAASPMESASPLDPDVNEPNEIDRINSNASPPPAPSSSLPPQIARSQTTDDSS